MTKFPYLKCAVFAPILIAALVFSGLAGAEAGMNVPVANLTNASLGSGVGGNKLAGNDDNTVKCESNDGRRKYCGSANYNQVALQRQLSSASCVQGESWGVDGRGLWVDRGCRAIFYLGGNGQYDNHGGYHGGSITCESNDGQRKYCGRVGRDVRLQRQLSQSPCVQGQSWGVDGQGLWVDRGCRAEFSSGGGNWDNNGGTTAATTAGRLPANRTMASGNIADASDAMSSCSASSANRPACKARVGEWMGRDCGSIAVAARNFLPAEIGTTAMETGMVMAMAFRTTRG